MLNLYARLAPWILTLLELLLLAAAGTLILFSSRTASGRGQPGAFTRIERAFTRLARRRRLAVFLVGFSVVAIRAALIPVLGIPQPSSHDEFSYLLAADTFAHHHITNLTHPMWVHFENFHVIQQPTYMSIYPPAQGLILAAGQFLGHPWIGQVLATALMCSSLCWMLQGWVPPSWALLGAGLAIFKLGILGYWMNGYWSASIVALGGALVLGAYPRLKKRKRPRIADAVLMAMGLLILANTRPYEGLIFAIPVFFAMLFWLLNKDRPPFNQTLLRVILPILAVLLAGFLATGYYYYRVTGNPFRMTYLIEIDTYAAAPIFLWQTPHGEVTSRHKVIRDFFQWERDAFRENHTLRGYLHRTGVALLSWWQVYVGPLLTVLAIACVFRRKQMWLPFLICAAVVVALAVETWAMPHYFSPATCVLYLFLVQGARHLWHWQPAGRPLGKALVRAIPVLACGMIFLRVATAGAHLPIESPWPRGNLKRSAMLSDLNKKAGLHLVIVLYESQHNFDNEWVYNDANIDSAKVVWARDMGKQNNQELLQYFRSRNVWLVDADAREPRAVPYPD
ncbi:MAG: hypothetical protein JWQ87_333 [Candidatus Sulfotelmatobacter sp.]|nr:hypothetical protein [Candidatus Sulfotelmatobacter sp.]